MNSFGPGKIQKYGDQIAIVMHFHLLGELVVTVHRVGLDLVRERKKIDDAGDSGVQKTSGSQLEFPLQLGKVDVRTPDPG